MPAFKSIFSIRVLFFLILLSLMGCASAVEVTPSAAPQIEAEDTQTPIPPTQTRQVPSPTIPASATPSITPSPLPTFTNTPVPTLGVLEDGISIWCLPEGSAVASLNQPGAPPQSAKVSQISSGGVEINGLPVSGCVFVYHFNQNAPSDLSLEVYDMNLDIPWLTVDLMPVENDPASAAGSSTHSYIITPPYWDISYYFVVTDSSGNEIRRDLVNLHRWKPELCWNGQLPNLKTMRCPLPLDLHPWDAGYGTPMPTFPPED